MFNLSVLMEDGALRYGSKTAFNFGNTNLSFAEVNTMANKLANSLIRMGLQPGQKVAMSCPNCTWFPIIYYATLKAGAVIVPLNVLLKADEIHYYLEDSEAAFYFCFTGSAEMPVGEFGLKAFNEVATCQKIIMIEGDKQRAGGAYNLEDLMREEADDFETFATEPNDTAVIIYTSGTTGKPKGAELSHSNLFCNALLSAELFSLDELDTQIVVLPLFHIFGMTVLLNAGLYRGVKSVLIARFDVADVTQKIDQHQATIFVGVPTMYWALLHNVTDAGMYKSLRLCVAGGASLPVAVLEGFEKKFKVEVLEGYGMSEGSPVVTFNNLKTGRKPGSIGTPVWGVSVKVVNDKGEEQPEGEKGELIYKGHNVMKGYYHKPKETAEVLKNGWLYSGDVAIKDKDGFFFIVDRIKDVIIRGGLNVYPREVEEVLMQHPKVSLAAIVGVPDDKYGEEIKAFIVLKDQQHLEKEEVVSWTKQHLAAYKYPRVVEFKTSLPMTATGKLLKKELKNC